MTYIKGRKPLDFKSALDFESAWDFETLSLRAFWVMKALWNLKVILHESPLESKRTLAFGSDVGLRL